MPGVQAELLEHRHEEIGEGRVVLTIERDMPSVLKSTAGQQDREVGVFVGVRVSHITSVKNHHLVQESGVPIASSG